MKEARYLIRIASDSKRGPSQPADQADLLTAARQLAHPSHGKVINLRVSPFAIEFDLFCAPDADLTPLKEAFRSLGTVITCKRLDLPSVPVTPQKAVDEARALFNEHRFWEVHEVLEGVWKALEGKEKQLVQGLILAAAALVHAQKNETSVMWPMLRDALARLDGQPDVYLGWDIRRFRELLTHMLASQTLEIPTV